MNRRHYTILALAFLITRIALTVTPLASLDNSTPASNNITDIITVGDTVWVATDKGISISPDGGASWRDELEEHSFLCITAALGEVWCASSYYSSAGYHIGTGLYRSNYQSDAWEHIFPLPATWGDDFVDEYVADEKGLDLVCYELALMDLPSADGGDGRDTMLWAPYYYGGLLRSSDHGQTWVNIFMDNDVTLHTSPSASERFFSFTADTSADTTLLFAGALKGLFVSRDLGESWKRLYTTTLSESESTEYQELYGPYYYDSLGIVNISGNTILELSTQYIPGMESAIIWASTAKYQESSEYNGVSRSIDGGDSWEVVDSGYIVWDFAFNDSIVWLASDRGLFKSADLGSTWDSIEIIDANTGVHIYSDDIQSIHYDSHNSALWAGSDQGLARLDEKSGTWEIIKTFPDPREVDGKTYAFPNPFSVDQHKTASIVFPLDRGQEVTIELYDFPLFHVNTIIDAQEVEPNSEDNGEIQWGGLNKDGYEVDNGIYFYKVSTERKTYWGKIAVLK